MHFDVFVEMEDPYLPSSPFMIQGRILSFFCPCVANFIPIVLPSNAEAGRAVYFVMDTLSPTPRWETSAKMTMGRGLTGWLPAICKPFRGYFPMLIELFFQKAKEHTL